MTELNEIINYIDKLFPPELAFDGDNVGLIVGSKNKKVSKVLITLDVDEKVADEASKLGADVIISHHPLMFHSTKRLTESSPEERTLMSLIKNDISLFSAHTNLDCAKDGLNDFLAEKLGIENTSVVEPVATIDGQVHGYGRVGEVPAGTKLSDILKKCTSELNTPFVRYVGNPEKEIRTVAVNCGGGADEIEICIKRGIDLFVTGDVKYNPAGDCYDNDMCLIDAGHYETEHIVCELLKDKLSRKFPDICFEISKDNIAVFKVYNK